MLWKPQHILIVYYHSSNMNGEVTWDIATIIYGTGLMIITIQRMPAEEHERKLFWWSIFIKLCHRFNDILICIIFHLQGERISFWFFLLKIIITLKILNIKMAFTLIKAIKIPIIINCFASLLQNVKLLEMESGQCCWMDRWTSTCQN